MDGIPSSWAEQRQRRDGWSLSSLKRGVLAQRGEGGSS